MSAGCRRCGCARFAHQHYRKGTNCGVHADCPAFLRSWPWTRLGPRPAPEPEQPYELSDERQAESARWDGWEND